MLITYSAGSNRATSTRSGPGRTVEGVGGGGSAGRPFDPAIRGRYMSITHSAEGREGRRGVRSWAVAGWAPGNGSASLARPTAFPWLAAETSQPLRIQHSPAAPAGDVGANHHSPFFPRQESTWHRPASQPSDLRDSCVLLLPRGRRYMSITHSAEGRGDEGACAVGQLQDGLPATARPPWHGLRPGRAARRDESAPADSMCPGCCQVTTLYVNNE